MAVYHRVIVMAARSVLHIPVSVSSNVAPVGESDVRPSSHKP